MFGADLFDGDPFTGLDPEPAITLSAFYEFLEATDAARVYLVELDGLDF